MSTEIAVRDADVRIAEAGDVARVCKQIVTATAMNIRGRRYVKVEGWQAIAVAHGLMASAGDVQSVEGGIRAVATLRRIEDGATLCSAEGFVGDDEPMWQSRPLYARRAMAQTRAISRVCRSAFAHVVVMMAAGLETTPAEEVPYEDEPAPRKGGDARSRTDQPATATSVSRDAASDEGGAPAAGDPAPLELTPDDERADLISAIGAWFTAHKPPQDEWLTWKTTYLGGPKANPAKVDISALRDFWKFLEARS